MDATTLPRPAEMLSAREALRIIAELQVEVRGLREQVEELSTYREMAYRDGLTGLRNRRFFEERLAEEASRASRAGQHAFTLLLCDVNGLKAINDNQGHQAGDRAISEAAAFLQSSLRDYDVCCRIGGDEFAVILPGVTRGEIPAVLSRLEDGMRRAQKHGCLSVDVAVGAVAWSEALAHPAALVAAADVAMYAAKSRMKGGGHFAVAEQSLPTVTLAGRPMNSNPVSDQRGDAPPPPGIRSRRTAARTAHRVARRFDKEYGTPPAQSAVGIVPHHASGGRLSDRWGPRTRGGFAQGIISFVPLTRLS